MYALNDLNSKLPPVLPHEREFFINRIWCGYTNISYDGKRFKILDPTPELKYEAEEIYFKSYARAQNMGVLSSEQLLSVMMSYGYWNDANEKDFQVTLPKEIEHWKVQLFKYSVRSSLVGQFRKTLNAVTARYNDLRAKRNMYFSASCDGVASFAKWQYLIGRCTRIGRKKCDWTETNIHHIMNHYHSARFSDKMLRYLSRTSPWTAMVASSKYLSGLTSKSAIEMTDEQICLLSWTATYENVRKACSTPSEVVINDDDMLDGWFIVQEQERKAKQVESDKGNMFSDKVGRHNEVLIMVNNAKEASDIYSLNDPILESKRKARMQQLNQAGQLKESEFADVALDLRMRKNRLFAEKLKQGQKT